MSEVVQFPGAEPPPEGYSEQYIDKLHSDAFCDLESEVCDLERMGEISQRLIMGCCAREDGLRELELAQFAVLELAKMLRELRASYYKRYHNEPVSS